MASCRIWDALGFKRIGRVKGCGNLKSYPDQYVDAIIYGRDLGPEGEDYVSEERFDKIRYYLKHGKYPNGADRAEKSRLRSAATHYKLIPATDDEPERLMLKGKEVIADPQRQYEISRQVHLQHHGGINKTTASIAEKYHWVRIKETVSQVIRNCPDCKDMAKAPPVRPEHSTVKRPNGNPAASSGVSAAGRTLSLPHQDTTQSESSSPEQSTHGVTATAQALQSSFHINPDPPEQHPMPMAGMQGTSPLVNYQVPVDPRIIHSMQPPYIDFSHPAQQHLAQHARQTSEDTYLQQPDGVPANYSGSIPSTQQPHSDSTHIMHHPYQFQTQHYHDSQHTTQSADTEQGSIADDSTAARVAQQAMMINIPVDSDEEGARALRQSLLNAGFGADPGHNHFGDA